MTSYAPPPPPYVEPPSRYPLQTYGAAPSAQQPAYGSGYPQRALKDVTIAYLLLIFLGGLGVHRFYLGHIGLGILYLFTGGLLGVGVLVDLFLMPGAVRTVNYRITNGR
jgi:TM2 domain-containing membrane protein YozV